MTGSFGLGWSTNLDERVILGTEANVQDIYDAYAEYLLELETNLKAMENQIKEDFFVEDPYSVVDEANIRIKTAEELLKKLNELKKEYEDTKKKTEEAEQELQMTKSRKERNKKAMFKGLGLYFEETGLDTVTYVDERGYPYLMYQHENYSNVWQSKDRDCVCVFENDEYTVYKGC